MSGSRQMQSTDNGVSASSAPSVAFQFQWFSGCWLMAISRMILRSRAASSFGGCSVVLVSVWVSPSSFPIFGAILDDSRKIAEKVPNRCVEGMHVRTYR